MKTAPPEGGTAAMRFALQDVREGKRACQLSGIPGSMQLLVLMWFVFHFIQSYMAVCIVLS